MTFAEQLGQVIANKSREGQFSGVVLVKQDNDDLFRAAYGYADHSWKVENRVDTRFRIASVSKLFTAVAILQLIESDKLSLDTSVQECLGLKNTTIPKEATVEHMLTMTSGIADWFEESGDWDETWAALCREHPIYLFRRNEDYLPLFINKTPNFPVGEKHRYNGAGYILLGLIIERISGIPYFEYIRQHIFEKTEMTRSDFVSLDGVSEEVAEGYIPIEEDDRIIGWKKNIYSTTPEAAADGGATSTIDDLTRFSRALRSGQLLSEKFTHEMLTPKVMERAEKFRSYTWKYGYANFFLLDDDEQVVRWGHTGEEDGVSCRLYYYPKENLDVVILGNQSWCAASLAWEIHDLIIKMSP